jgi:phosphoglycolate phosphatase-like HAD superfamily hydrolase
MMIVCFWTVIFCFLLNLSACFHVHNGAVHMVKPFNGLFHNGPKAMNAGIESIDDIKCDSTRRVHLRSIAEVQRKFRLASGEVHEILNPKAHGFAGVVFTLENSMTDLTKVFGYSLAILAGELNQEVPGPSTVKMVVGNTFPDILRSLHWVIPGNLLTFYEKRFFAIFDAVLEKLPVVPKEGAVKAIRHVLSEKNEVVVTTRLPRCTALRVLGLTGLGDAFEGLVPPDHLLCYQTENETESESDSDSSESRSDLMSTWGPDTEDRLLGERYDTQELVDCCAALGKTPARCVVVTSSQRAITAAKRSGFSCIGITGTALHCTVCSTLVLEGLPALFLFLLFFCTRRDYAWWKYLLVSHMLASCSLVTHLYSVSSLSFSLGVSCLLSCAASPFDE